MSVAGESKDEDRFRQVRHFNFLVDFGEGQVAGFQDASGLGTGLVSLKRGLCCGPELIDWLASPGPGARRDVTLRLVDERRQPVMEWILAAARPVNWSAPDLRADAAEAAIEQLDLAGDGMTLHSGPGPN